MNQLTHALFDGVDDYNSKQKVEIPLWFHNLSVYKSELELRDPHKFSKTSLLRHSDLVKRSEPKLNTEETAYKERISSLISAWIKTLPKKRNKAEDIIIEETIINSLAGDIMDQVKLEAVAPKIWSEKEKYLSFFIYRWINRFEYFDDINNAKPYVDKLMKKLMDIPLPTHGTQQMKKINKFMKMTSSSQAALMPEDILEDEILIIINAQPSEIFINADKEIINQQVHEFALDIQNSSEDASKDVTKEIIEWLTKIIKPEEIQKLNSLKEQLKEKINSLLPETTSNNHYQDSLPHGTKDFENERETSVCCELNANNTYDSENAFKEFIAKYIEHYYDEENSIAREAFGEILKIELQKLSVPSTKVGYNNSTENEQHKIFTPNSLSRELKYINIISDWLKTLPLPTTFNRNGSIICSVFVNSLAKNLSNVDSTMIRLTGTEYRVYLASIINKYVDQLPIPTHHKQNATAMVDDLVQKIEEVRPQPCCQMVHCKSNITSINSNDITDKQLLNFIEEYIRENYEELSEDKLKLDALSTRLFKEINKMRSEIPAPSNADEAEETDEPIRRLSFELAYAKEITDCLNDLTILPIIDKTSRDLRFKMISKLAEKMYERSQALHDNCNTILSEYLMRWISEFPLDTSNEIDESVVIQQLLNRMEIVNRQKLERQEISQANHEKNSREMCEFPYTCCNKINTSQNNQDPGAAIVETIENWCAALPVQTEEEINNNMIKDTVATNLFKKLSELNMNPKCFTDNNLYRELLSDEIDKQLGNLPYNSKLQTVKEDLKQLLVSKIMEKRIEIREQASGTEYKQELEKTIEISLPNPVQTYQEESPGFKMYKDRLATLFILDNFDHGFDEVKESYEKIIKKEIDKYFEEAQKRNAIPLSKDQFFNQLYSALFNVPLPNNSSITEEVEEIKTRCEIDAWFETLPLRTASSDGEVLARDQIGAMLAKRIHRMEKYEQNPDSKIHKEIAKWLLKLPLLPGHEDNVDELAHKLLQRLKATLRNRKCTQRNESVYKDFIINNNKRKDKGVLGTSQIAGPSTENKAWPCPASPTCCQISPLRLTKPADMLMNIVEVWCEQLPLQANTSLDIDNTKVIKDNLIIKVIMKISELNVNPEALNNDFLYDALLDDELENLLSALPTSEEFNQSKDLRKKQLKDAIKSVKPLIQKEKAKYEYKQDLQNIVDKFLKEPKNLVPKMKDLLVSLKDDIIDNFILYNYHKNDEEGSLYKMMVNVSVEKYFTEVCQNQNDNNFYNPMMIGNHLLCEMAKVPAPSKTAIVEEIREIRIKTLITDFFNDHSLCNSNDKLLMRNQIIATLAKRLNEVEKVSNTTENFNKIKNVIVKCLKKLGENVEEKEINALVQSLQNLQETEIAGVSESRYKRPPPFNDDQRYNQSVYAPAQHQTRYNEDKNNTEAGQWTSLLSMTPKDHDATTTNLKDKQSSQFNGQVANNIRESKTNYSNFKRGAVLTSSVRDQESNDEKATLEPNQKIGFRSTSMDKSDFADKPVEPTLTRQVTKSFTPNSQDHSKLSEQDGTFVQDINTLQSNSTDTSFKAAEDQQSIPPPFVLKSPIGQPHFQQNRSGRRQDSSSISNNRITKLPPYKSKKPLQNKTIRQPIEKKTYQQVPQEASEQDTQKVPTLEQSIANNQSYSFDGSTKHDKTKVPSSSLDDEARDRFPISSSITITKSSAPLRSKREPNLFSIPSQSSSSTAPFTPRRHLSDLNVPCCKRKPSFFFFNPSDVISESNSPARVGCTGPVKYTQTVEKKCRRKENSTSDKEDGSTECQCGKGRTRFCRSETPVCRTHKKKRCKVCNGLSLFCCKMPPCQYPGYYYY
nr:uncharacterized protein LOC117994608 [Maniola hyperantus]